MRLQRVRHDWVTELKCTEEPQLLQGNLYGCVYEQVPLCSYWCTLSVNISIDPALYFGTHIPLPLFHSYWHWPWTKSPYRACLQEELALHQVLSLALWVLFLFSFCKILWWFCSALCILQWSWQHTFWWTLILCFLWTHEKRNVGQIWIQCLRAYKQASKDVSAEGHNHTASTAVSWDSNNMRDYKGWGKVSCRKWPGECP